MKYYDIPPPGYAPERLTVIRTFLELREEVEATEWQRQHIITGQSDSVKQPGNRLHDVIKNSCTAMKKTRRSIDNWDEQQNEE